MGHYPNTALFNNPKKKIPEQGSEWPKLFRENNVEKTRLCRGGGGGVPLFLANFPNGLLFRLPRRPLMVRAALLRRSCDGAATESLLRRSRCCDGDAQTSSVALILRVASATRRAE